MKRSLVLQERESLKEMYPSLSLDTSRVPARVTGTMWLDSGIGFSIDLRIPQSYPKSVPVLKCDSREIPWEIDRHVMSKGVACLCVASEYRMHWPAGSDLTDFLRNLVRSFLIGQAFYQVQGHWPPGHERSHGPKGLIEAYQDLLAPM